MKKIERLRWVEEVFGRQYVLKYFLCKNQKEILKAIAYFEKRGLTWGMRTDTTEDGNQGCHCPFVYQGNASKALGIYREHKGNLYYIVYKNILKVSCNGVAQLVSSDDAAVFIEFNETDKHVAQRSMYDNLGNLRHLYISPHRHIWHDMKIVSCFSPEESIVVDRGFNEVYRLFFLCPGTEEITFAVALNKQLIIW